MTNPNQCRHLMYGIIIAGLCIAGLSLLLPLNQTGVDILTVLGAATALLGIVFGLCTVRCPYCGRLLSLKGWNTFYCPYCGEEFKNI